MILATASAPSARRFALVVGESLLLLAVCVAINGYEEILDLIKHPRAKPLPWTPMLSRAALIVGACQLAYTFQDLYDWRFTSNRNLVSIRLLQSVFYAALFLLVVYYCLNLAGHFLDLPQLAEYRGNKWSTLASLVLVLPLSYSYRMFFHWTFRHWNLTGRIVVLGSSEMAKTIETELKGLADPGYQIIGYIETPGEPSTLESPCLGQAEETCQIAREHRADRVVVALTERRGRLPLIELLNCRLAGIRVEEAESLYERLTGKIAVQRLRPSYLIFSEGFERSRVAFAIKRAMDVGLAVVGMILLAPLCTIVALAIKLDSKGAVFYGQKRVGKDGEIFTTYKFRTMRSDAEQSGQPQWAKANDDRVTRVGRCLRRTRIDEIPQMWNVLKNEMSFVGPRPERPFFVDELRKQIPYYMERLLVKPGITGWAQINYQYGSSVEDALTKLQYDLYYIKNLSIYLDAMVLVRTVKVVVMRRGAV
jgi:sugar transferase (PEP-CTERM system associated)